MDDEQATTDALSLTAMIVSSYVKHNIVVATELPALIADVHLALTLAADKGSELAEHVLKPSVSINKSVTADHIICLEDGKKFKSLRRHLRTDHGLTPEDYRAKWNLPRDYPMVAPNYAAFRSRLAKKIGLGRKRRKRLSR